MSGIVPDALTRLEPLACLALALHGVAVVALDPAGWAWAILTGAGVLAVLGAVGVAGRRRPVDAAARAGAVLVVGLVLQALPTPAASYLLLWYFVLAAVYPLVVVPRVGALLVPAVPVAYLVVVALAVAGPGRTPDGTVAIGVVRGLSLAFVGAFSLLAARAYRASAADREGVLALLDGRERESAQLAAYHATHDGLTGLPNRVLLADRLAVALAQRVRSGGHVAVLFCDLDRFKVVNDSLGHSAGDELLREVARRLAAAVRPGDTLARLGGDEFAAVCAGVVDVEEARVLGERLRRAVAEPVPVAGRRVTVTASVGVVLACPEATDHGALLRDADVALYEAKDAGRDRVSVLDERRRMTATQRLDTEDELRDAVAGDRIRVAYQPVVALGAGADEGGLGFEALARWWSPSGGEVPPSTFIPLAEDLGLILPLGTQVLRRACDAAVDWRRRHQRPLTVAVNLSARQLAQPDVTTAVEAVLRATGLPPSALQLEITESVLVSDVRRSVERIGALRELGVQVAIDDFGTGYSSLAYLRDLPVDVLKIDRSFVHRLPEDERLLGAIVDLAHTLDVVAVAEGVETADQLAVLERIGCDRAQGYLLGRPLSPDQADRYLATGTSLGGAR